MVLIYIISTGRRTQATLTDDRDWLMGPAWMDETCARLSSNPSVISIYHSWTNLLPRRWVFDDLFFGDWTTKVCVRWVFFGSFLSCSLPTSTNCICITKCLCYTSTFAKIRLEIEPPQIWLWLLEVHACWYPRWLHAFFLFSMGFFISNIYHCFFIWLDVMWCKPQWSSVSFSKMKKLVWGARRYVLYFNTVLQLVYQEGLYNVVRF